MLATILDCSLHHCLGALISEEADQVIGHHGDTYRQLYVPDLIQAVARMGLTWDRRALIELTPLVMTTDWSGFVNGVIGNSQKVTHLGFYPLRKAAGHPNYVRYKDLEWKINSVMATLREKMP